MRRLLRVLLVCVVAGGALGYGAIANQAKAASTINLQLQLTIHCNAQVPNSGFQNVSSCAYAGATLDGTFVGTYVPIFGAGGPCNETWGLSDGTDSLYGTMTCPGSPPIYASVNPSISVTSGTGRFAGYTAPSTPQPTFVYSDVYAPLPSLPPFSIPTCGWHSPVNCPESGTGTGVVSLTLTNPA